MKIKVGDYVRSNGKIYKIGQLGYKNKTFMSNKEEGWYVIEKSSPDIIDLIEVGDYVNGYKVIDIAFAPSKAIYVEKKCEGAILPVSSIETIITKEQFEAMKYEIK